ncbi:MAG: FHA domain-containing protein, partial [Pseudanabaenaceae cyanobacterium]
TLIGRAEDCDIHLDRTSVSRHHAIIKRENNRYSITDLGSRMGTLVNGTPITPHTPCPLQHQDRIEISRYLLEVYLVPSAVPEPPPPAEGTVAYQFSPTEQENKISINFRNKSNLTIGRDPSNDVVLSHPAVSAFHGIVTRFDGSIYITDLNSRNGIFVNGKRVKGRKSLNYNDRVRIASYSLIFNEDQTFTSIDESGKIRIDAVDLCQVIDDANTRQKRNLLNHISVSILPREFVIIAGVSGGGKSTLMDALNGFRPASSGVVYFNGLNLYQNYDAYRSEIGYVPQQDIVHTDLTVYQALNFAARLRMPPDVRPQEREQRITQVLTELKLLERKNTKIARLSGGQKKRVSIALELLTEPSLFFLDEATSGLDPATDREVMQILRQIADSGKTVLLITHATENVKIADQVLFLAKGGNLAYFGPPSEIQKYFSTVAGETIDTFTDIYRVVEDQSKRSGEQWRAEFMQSSYYQKYVRQRQKQIDLHAPSHTSAKKTETAANTSLLSQFWILLQRNFLLLFSDRVSTVLVILVTPILGFLDTLTWDRNLFDVVLGNSGQAITMLFNMGLVAIIAGCLSTMREIIKEADIYKRERATGLKTSAYILSKLCFCIVLALYQSATLLACKYISVNLPGTLWQYYLIMFLSSLAGTILGLFVSSISPNQNVTPLLAIVLLIPQITFGGGVLPVRSLSGIGGIINQVTLTKWPFEALVTVSGIGKDVVQDQCWNLTKAEREQLTDVDKQEKCICLGENIFKYCQFPGILADYDAESIDKPEPVQPKRPASPGKIPSNPLEMPDYEKKVDKFNRDLESWEKNMQKWRSDFSKWKEKRESLIGSAEGIISQIRDDYGQGFAVNIWGHMRNMIIQICFLVVLIFYLQKRRDAL